MWESSGTPVPKASQVEPREAPEGQRAAAMTSHGSATGQILLVCAFSSGPSWGGWKWWTLTKARYL